MTNNSRATKLRRIALILTFTTCVWFAIDRLTKIFFDSGQFALGQDITGSVLGIFHLTLVHNTGAAFGIFANGTILLGALSIAISLALLAIPFILENYNNRKQNNNTTNSNSKSTNNSNSSSSSTLTNKANLTSSSTPTFSFSSFQLFSVAIVAAGGIGNAIDRFVTGYVVDFICFDFVNFPVFNIADIGVTCGILFLLTNLLYLSFKPRT